MGPLPKSDSVSAQWQGFIKLDQAGDYVFSLHTNDGAKLWINQQLVLDEFTTAADQVKGHRLISEPIAF